MAIPGYFRELHKTVAENIKFKIDTKESDYPVSDQTFVDGYKTGLITALAILNDQYIQILDIFEKTRDRLNMQQELNALADKELNHGRE